MNFHAPQNQLSYTARAADPAWLATIRAHVDVQGKQVVDIGCGGGIYSRALAGLGAAQVTGVDFSAEMLKGAALNCADIENIAFAQGSADQTGLPDNAFDIILERALIHHLQDLSRCFNEAHRLLKNDGVLIIQDRTPQDCLLPGSDKHFRGYFFEKYPRLIQTEVSRRHDSPTVRTALASSSFAVIAEVPLWETRRVYSDFTTLRQDLLQRKGRSILHELNDDELADLVDYIQAKLQDAPLPIIEQDAWAIWFAQAQ